MCIFKSILQKKIFFLVRLPAKNNKYVNKLIQVARSITSNFDRNSKNETVQWCSTASQVTKSCEKRTFLVVKG